MLKLFFSLIAAGIILLLFVLPAEYGKDPTGLGSRLGVLNMSVEDGSNNKPKSHTRFEQSLEFLETEIVLEEDGQVEYKFELQKGHSVNYQWNVSGGDVYADLHGHTPGPSGEVGDEILVQYLESEEENRAIGQFTAPFAGEHGWYFYNLERGSVTISIKASGIWDEHKLVPLGKSN